MTGIRIEAQTPISDHQAQAQHATGANWVSRANESRAISAAVVTKRNMKPLRMRRKLPDVAVGILWRRTSAASVRNSTTGTHQQPCMVPAKRGDFVDELPEKVSQ